jgi:polyhydroxyalkanoate synthesis regulator phasin
VSDRLADIRKMLDTQGRVLTYDARWMADEIDALRERVAVLRAEVTDLEALRS